MGTQLSLLKSQCRSVFFFVFLVAYTIKSADATDEDLIPFPEGHGVVGDSPPVNLEAVDTGLALNPYTNDVFGHTDKINTHSMGAAYSGRNQSISYRSSWHWRLITPIYKTERSGQSLPQPIGQFADWMEVRQAILFPIWSSSYLQGELGLSHLGPKGGKDIQNMAHQFWGVQRRYSWENSSRRVTLNGGVEAGWIEPLNASRIKIGIGYSENYLTEEAYATASYQMQIIENAISTEETPILAVFSSIQISRLFDSSFAETKPYHFLGSLKLAIWGFWQPSLTLSSPFIEGDQTPQIHVSPFDLFLAL